MYLQGSLGAQDLSSIIFHCLESVVVIIGLVWFWLRKSYLRLVITGLLLVTNLDGWDLYSGDALIGRCIFFGQGLAGIALCNMTWWILLRTRPQATARSIRRQAFRTRSIDILFSATALLLNYSNLFEVLGLKDTVSGKLVHNIYTAMYFSVVTWTTVGYGDVVPHDSWTRFLSALGAINGYILVAALIATLLPIFAQGIGEEDVR